MTLRAASESDEQAALVRWVALQHPRLLMFSIPNGSVLAGDATARARQMAHLKRTGLVPGVPDLCIVQPGGRVLWVEMKSISGSLSGEQKAIHARLREAGHRVIVAYGFDHAREQIEAELGAERQGEFQHIGDVAKRLVASQESEPSQ